jgi:hypothetical protein
LNSYDQGKLFINKHEVECIFPDAGAPQGIQVHWAVASSSRLLFRTDSTEKRMDRFWELQDQFSETYKILWSTESMPPILRSRHGAPAGQNHQEQHCLSKYTTKTMIPTSLLISMMIWGIQRPRRPVEDVNRTISNFRALWSITFAVIKEGKCRVQRDDDRYFGFMISPHAQAPFLRCLFSEVYLEQIRSDWTSLYQSRSSPEWMSSGDMNHASVLDVVVFMMLPGHGQSYRHVIAVIHSVIRTFSTCVDQMGRDLKKDQIAESSTYRNRGAYSATIAKRKAICAQFLLRENVSLPTFCFFLYILLSLLDT